MVSRFDKCQRAYDAMLPEDPEEIQEKESKQSAKVERQIDDYEDRRRAK